VWESFKEGVTALGGAVINLAKKIGGAIVSAGKAVYNFLVTNCLVVTILIMVIGIVVAYFFFPAGVVIFIIGLILFLICFGPIISDIRVKRDIVQVGRLPSGLGLYRYRYKWSDEIYVGVLAQEVAKVAPAAVRRGLDGYLRVNYRRLDLKFMTWSEWLDRAPVTEASPKMESGKARLVA
jgi:hypothetical protein